MVVQRHSLSGALAAAYSIGGLAAPVHPRQMCAAQRQASLTLEPSQPGWDDVQGVIPHGEARQARQGGNFQGDGALVAILQLHLLQESRAAQYMVTKS